MAERRDLLEIHKLLADGEDLRDQMSDLEVLRSIVSLVKAKNISQHEGDSLAFPTDTRHKVDLTSANELWNQLESFNDNLRQDYTCRRRMLLQRLDCTVESFKWKGTTASRPDKVVHEPRSGVGKSLNEQIHERYDKVRMTFKEEPQISVANLLAIREKDCDRLLNGVISSKNFDCIINYGSKKSQKANSSEQINLKQVIIPQVPDRGGRTGEIRPPVKESFSRQRGGSKHGRSRHK